MYNVFLILRTVPIYIKILNEKVVIFGRTKKKMVSWSIQLVLEGDLNTETCMDPEGRGAGVWISPTWKIKSVYRLSK